VKNKDWKFWAVFVGLLLIGYLIYRRIKQTQTDASNFAKEVYINPLKTLFG